VKKQTPPGRRPFWFGLLTLSFTSASLLSGTAFAQKYQETNLVSNTSQSGVTTVDPDLVNCWGISRSSTGTWWAADDAKGVATLYSGTGIMPGSGQNATEAPTGIVFNGSTDFDVISGKPAVCIFAAFEGKFEHQNGNVVGIPGIWGLAFGAGNTNSGGPNQLLFNAGVDQGKAGLFGFFAPVTTDLTQGNDQ